MLAFTWGSLLGSFHAVGGAKKINFRRNYVVSAWHWMKSKYVGNHFL